MRRAAFALVVSVGCTRAAIPTPGGADAAIVTVAPVTATDASPEDAREAGDAMLSGPRRWVAVGASGVEIALSPEDALVEDPPRRFTVRRSVSVSVALSPADSPAPTSIPDVGRVYGADAEAHDLGTGTTPDGALYALRSFRVRVGHTGVGGQIVHGFKRVARAESILPVRSDFHVTCTGYVEHDVTEVTDADFDWVAKICLSLRKKR